MYIDKRQNREPATNPGASIDLRVRENPAGNNAAKNRAKTARTHHQPGAVRSVGNEVLKEQRQNRGCPIENGADQEQQKRPDGKIAVPQDPQIDDRVFNP